MDTKRLGCLFIPEIRIQIHQRDERLELTTPLILLTRHGHASLVAAVSPAAEAAGVRVGMRLAQAELACPDALIREETPARYAEVGQGLLGRLLALVPVVEAIRLGWYYLGMQGLRWLYRDEAALMQAVLEEVARAGLRGSAGAAGTRFTALVAARGAPPGQLRQVASGDERAFLAPMPLSILPASAELLERLRLLGLSTLGELAALAPRSVERRYGDEGIRMYRLARAGDDAHLVPTRLPAARQRSALLEAPTEQAEGLLFVLAPLVASLLDELAHEGRACAGMTLGLRLEGGSVLELPALLGSPVTVPKPLLEILRLKLARVQLPAGVTEVRLEATHVTDPSTPQGDLFRRVGSPSGMAVTLARLIDALGSDAVVTARLADAYRIDRTFTTVPVHAGAPGLLAAAGTGSQKRGRASRAAATGAGQATGAAAATGAGQATGAAAATGAGQATGAAAVVGRAGATAVAGQTGPAWESSSRETSAMDGERLDACFRRIEPHLEMHIQLDDAGPLAVIAGSRRRQVTHRRGPFRYDGLWWESSYSRDYFQLRLADGAEVLVFRDLETDRWYLEGVYD